MKGNKINCACSWEMINSGLPFILECPGICNDCSFKALNVLENQSISLRHIIRWCCYVILFSWWKVSFEWICAEYRLVVLLLYFVNAYISDECTKVIDEWLEIRCVRLFASVWTVLAAEAKSRHVKSLVCTFHQGKPSVFLHLTLCIRQWIYMWHEINLGWNKILWA